MLFLFSIADQKFCPTVWVYYTLVTQTHTCIVLCILESNMKLARKKKKKPYQNGELLLKWIMSPAALQAPGASLLTRTVTPTTIIKQGSTVHTTVTATTTLQRPPVLQVTAFMPMSWV